MNLFLGKSSEKHLKCEKYDKRKARAFAWDFVYSLKGFKKIFIFLKPFFLLPCLYTEQQKNMGKSAASQFASY